MHFPATRSSSGNEVGLTHGAFTYAQTRVPLLLTVLWTHVLFADKYLSLGDVSSVLQHSTNMVAGKEVPAPVSIIALREHFTLKKTR